MLEGEQNLERLVELRPEMQQAPDGGHHRFPLVTFDARLAKVAAVGSAGFGGGFGARARSARTFAACRSCRYRAKAALKAGSPA